MGVRTISNCGSTATARWHAAPFWHFVVAACRRVSILSTVFVQSPAEPIRIVKARPPFAVVAVVV